MSLCTIIIQNDQVVMAADTALSAEINGTTYRVSNQGRKLFQFGNEIVFCSGAVACVNALIPQIEIKDKRIDRQKLSDTLRQMIPQNLRKRKNSKETLTGVLVIIGGVINGNPYLWSISEENDFIPELIEGEYSVTWRGFRAEEAVAMKATPTQFINLINGDFSDFLIETYQRLICAEVGGYVDAFSVDKDCKVKHFMNQCSIQDDTPIHLISEGQEKIDIQIRNMQSLPTVHAIIQATGGNIGGWKIGKNSIHHVTDTWGASNGMYIGEKGLSVTDKFKVDKSGKIVATDASIEGMVAATELKANDKIIIRDTTDKKDKTALDTKYPSSYGNLSIGGDFSLINMIPPTTFIKEVSCMNKVSIYGDTTMNNAAVNNLSCESLTATAANISCTDFQANAGNYHVTTSDGSVCLMASYDSRGAFLRSQTTKDRTYDKAANMFISQEGTLGKAASSSSRYKHDIETLGIEEISSLYNLPIRKFKYNNDYLSSDSERYDREIPGFIAEEVDEILPIAVDHLDDGRAEMWNVNVIVPCLLKLIQSNYEHIKTLEKQIEILKPA